MLQMSEIFDVEEFFRQHKFEHEATKEWCLDINDVEFLHFVKAPPHPLPLQNIIYHCKLCIYITKVKEAIGDHLEIYHSEELAKIHTKRKLK